MPAKLFRRILVPHDFSKPADRALEEAVALARAHGGRLIVHHAIPPFYLPIDPRFGTTVERMPDAAAFVPEMTARLERIVGKAVGRTRVRYRVDVTVGEPAVQLLEAARHADCVVMSTHGRSGLAHLLLGSVAEKIVRHSPVPVLTIRTRAKTGTARTKRREHRQAA